MHRQLTTQSALQSLSIDLAMSFRSKVFSQLIGQRVQQLVNACEPEVTGSLRKGAFVYRIYEHLADRIGLGFMAPRVRGQSTTRHYRPRKLKNRIEQTGDQ